MLLKMLINVLTIQVARSYYCFIAGKVEKCHLVEDL